MRAIVIDDHGATPHLADIPSPDPGPGEVLVQVRASSVNGFDVAVASGMLKGAMEHRFPVVLGKDFAGVVARVGEGVSRFAVGDPVFGVVMKPYLGDGGFAAYVAVGDAYGIAPMPEGLDPASAGAVGLAGAAALAVLAAAAPAAGDTVLIFGATGGVGALAIQYARTAGATVVATARPGEEADFVQGLGAHHTLDRDGDLAAQLRAIAPDGVSVVIHLAGDAGQLTPLLASGGRLASTVGYGVDQHPAATAVMANPDSHALDRLAADVVAGRLRVPITHTYVFDEVPAAIVDFRAGALGKLAVAVQ
jgi:NADPH:quinone reductase-like Zn-dependent oxidoreductase